ncbi:MAG: Eco57I restriction-modification methylase domain-containing protein [Anaerolineae bacterium]
MESQPQGFWSGRKEGGDLPVSLQHEETRRALGMVYTPPELVDFMVWLGGLSARGPLRVLEPACGDSPFLRAFVAQYGSAHDLTGVDIYPQAVALSKEHLPRARFIETDYLLWQPEEPFDLILGNPPYGIIGDGSHYPIHLFKERKHLYKRRFTTWHGKFNIYGAFIEQSVHLLKPGGRLVFVVPATWLVLDDFAKLRQLLATSGRVTVYYWGKAFPKRNVSVVVLCFEKGSKGMALCDKGGLVVWKPNYHGELIRFETPEALAFERDGVPLGRCFAVHFAARSTEFRRHPFVEKEARPGLVPVLTGRNLHRGWIDYETCYSGLWMPLEKAPALRPFYGYPHLVVAHTKGARVVAALESRCYPWREEFHLVPKGNTPDLEGLVEYLNSEAVQRHTLSLYRDFVPHLTATMLRLIPLPRSLVGLEGVSEQLPLWQGDRNGEPPAAARV